MTVKEKQYTRLDKQNRMSSHVRRIRKRYGLGNDDKGTNDKARTINELYEKRYKNKFH